MCSLKDEINLAVIGCGVIGRVHCTAISSLASVDSSIKLHSVFDKDLSKSKEIQKQYHCEVATSSQQIFDCSDIDLVLLATPHNQHCEQFIKSLSSGKHTLTEKPLAITPAEIKKMLLAAETGFEQSFYSGVLFQHRHSPLVDELKKIMIDYQGDKIGGCSVSFSCERSQAYYNQAKWRGTWQQEGGGVLINQAIHSLDLAFHILGDPVEVMANVYKSEELNIEVENEVSGDVSLATGVKVKLSAKNKAQSKWEPFIQISTERFKLGLDGSQSILKLESSSSEIKDRLLKAEKKAQISSTFSLGKKEYGQGLHKMAIKNFINSIRLKEPNIDGFKTAVKTNLCVLASYYSAVVGKGVHLEDEDFLKNYTYPKLTDLN